MCESKKTCFVLFFFFALSVMHVTLRVATITITVLSVCLLYGHMRNYGRDSTAVTYSYPIQSSRSLAIDKVGNNYKYYYLIS